jgi:hypothetical protein
MTRFNVNAGELLKTFAQSGESVAIIDRNGATYVAPDGPLDEIIIFGNRSLGAEEFGHLPDELLGRLKVGKRVSILLDDKSSSENPVSDFVRAYSLKFNGFVRIGNPTNDIESIARYTKVDGGESDKWPRAALYDGCIGNNAEEFFENWHAIQISKDILVLKPNQETTLPRADSFKKAQISTPEDNKGSNLYVLKNVFKSIDIISGKEAAEQGNACALFIIEGENNISVDTDNLGAATRVIRVECDLEIISPRFARFLLDHLLHKSEISQNELFNSNVFVEFFDKIVQIPRRFAQAATINFISSYDSFHPFANSQSELRGQLSPNFTDHELLMRSACRLKQISIEHRWSALQQLSYDLPAPVAHCIAAFFTRDDAEHRGRVASKLLDVAIELHTLVAVSVATDSFMPHAKSTAVAALTKAKKATLGTWIDSILNPIVSCYSRERIRLLSGAPETNLSRLGPGGVYAMDGLFGVNTFIAIKEMQRVRNDEGQAHAGLGHEAQSEQLAEQVVNAFISYFEATRVLWATLSLNYCRSISTDLSDRKATFNQLSGSSYLLPNKQFIVPEDFDFTPGQLALMPNRNLAETDRFLPIHVVALYYAPKPKAFEPIFVYFFNQMVAQPNATFSIVLNNYSYIEESRKTFASNDKEISNLSQLLFPATISHA